MEWSARAWDVPAGRSENLLSKRNTLSPLILLIGALVSLIQIYLNGLKGLGVVKPADCPHQDTAKSKHAALVFVCRDTLLPSV